MYENYPLPSNKEENENTANKWYEQTQNWMNLTHMSGNGPDGKTKTEPYTNVTWNIPYTCTQTPSYVWAKIFHLFCFSASRKLHFSVCPAHVSYGSLFIPLLIYCLSVKCARYKSKRTNQASIAFSMDWEDKVSQKYLLSINTSMHNHDWNNNISNTSHVLLASHLILTALTNGSDN